MRPAIRSLVAAGILAAASLGGATEASDHTLIDPTTLTPPLQFDLSCGTVYETSSIDG